MTVDSHLAAFDELSAEKSKNTIGSSSDDELSLTIEKIIPRGLGLGYHRGQAVFVPFAAPGERMRVRVTRRHRGYLSARCLEILAAGAQRVDPGCPVHESCGGCQMRHLNRAAQEESRRGFIVESLQRTAGIDAEGLVRPLLPVSPWHGYRRRAGFKGRWVAGRQLLGFYGSGTYRIVDLPGCPVLDPDLAALIQPLRACLATLSTRERPVGVDAVRADNGVGLVFQFQRKPSRRDRDLLTGFCRDRGILRAAWRLDRNAALRDLWPGKTLLYDAGGYSLALGLGDFIQINGAGNRRLLETVMAEVAEGGSGGVAWDLFCGVGNFTLPLSKRFAGLLAVESQPSALERTRNNARHHGIGHIDWLRADLFQEKGLQRLFSGPPPELVLMDPPREGAAMLAGKLSHSPPRRLIHVACDAATFARDAARLHQGGMRLISVQPLDLFPHTSHVELVAVFRKRDG